MQFRVNFVSKKWSRNPREFLIFSRIIWWSNSFGFLRSDLGFLRRLIIPSDIAAGKSSLNLAWNSRNVRQRFSTSASEWHHSSLSVNREKNFSTRWAKKASKINSIPLTHSPETWVRNKVTSRFVVKLWNRKIINNNTKTRPQRF